MTHLDLFKMAFDENKCKLIQHSLFQVKLPIILGVDRYSGEVGDVVFSIDAPKIQGTSSLCCGVPENI